jgi:hypothetical protein
MNKLSAVFFLLDPRFSSSSLEDEASLKFLTPTDGSQFTSMLIHPRIDGGIAFDSTVESQQFRSHRRSIFAFGSMLRGTPTRGPIRYYFRIVDDSPRIVLAQGFTAWLLFFRD